MKTTRPDIRLLDVGGTFIKCDDGCQVPVPSAGSRDAVAAAFREAVGSVASLKGIGIAIPGPFDYRNGIFLMKHKYASVYGECFRDLAGVPENVPVKYLHDVNAPLLGAVSMMGLQGVNCALVTLGTGLGFSYAVRGEVQCNSDGSPVRGLWDLPFGDGILEDRISARGICAAYSAMSLTEETGNPVTGPLTALNIARKAFAGEPAAVDVYRQTGFLLGRELKDLADELRLDMILMGGQISKSLDLLLEPLKEQLPGLHICLLPDGAVFKGLETLFL